MEDFEKVTSIQLYKLWKNLTIGMVTVIVMMTMSKLLPYFLSPVVALVCAAALYTFIYDSKVKRDTSCMIIPFGMLYALVGYSFVTIFLNVLYAWGIKSIAHEFVFFTNPFVPSLIMNPVCFIVFVYLTIMRKKLPICNVCRMRGDKDYEHGSLRKLFNEEIHFQLRNLAILFGLLTAIVWGYYFIFYVNININNRDWYVFTWVTTICFVLDEIYFGARYYNLYLDLRESNEIITQEELQDMTAKTYLRYYVICGNSMYVDTHVIDVNTPYKEVIDTPFATKRTMNGISVDEVKRIIKRMTGVDGDLRFFYGRKSSELTNQSLLRYFYFLEGTPEDYPELNTDGEWMDFDKIKYYYSNNPGKLADIMVTDTTRLATIILTEKTFDERGYRKSKIKFYNPSFNLHDVRKSELDFQDDKWIQISLFNSDTPLYGLKKWWREFLGDRKKKSNSIG
ncbi:MAG: hypothetical protein K2J78_07675 [Muribaculaceae bacterium]|nr:hypothetical protein [Muribaculaceae bacterium]